MPDEQPKHSVSVVVANGKGGTGKTTTVANLAGLFAAAGWRVLAIDLDPQGNLGADLGHNATGLSDDGRGLALTLAFEQPVQVLSEVRSKLDVLCGGEQLHSAVSALAAKQVEEVRPVLAKQLSTIKDNYDLIFLDTPPGIPILQDIALTAADFLLIPTRTDAASIDDGVEKIARRFADVRRTANPQLRLLGALLFATSFLGEREGKDGKILPATARHQRIRTHLEGLLGGIAPVFKTHIRYLEAAAADARGGSQLAFELEREAAAGPKWFETLRDPSLRGQRLASSAGSLAGDFQALAQEVLQLISGANEEEPAHA